MYLLGKNTSRSTNFFTNWVEDSNVEFLHTSGRVKSYLFQTLNNSQLFHSLSEWLSENHYLDYRKSLDYQKIMEDSKLEYDPDIRKLRLITQWTRNTTGRSYFTLIRFTSESEIDLIQSKLAIIKQESEVKQYGVDEIHFFSDFNAPSVYTLLLGWDSLTSLENWKNRLSNQTEEFSFLRLDYSNIYHIKLVYKWAE